ncbi:hypothetical protein [Actinomadura sp. NEAU-AAG7]|uniref:hypothetical protein n=1 Tax=Actinomadura sp. NEAU-AAG7 TaxID=2839640 RepID=UPI001BE48D2B|nr:hypothetical protein [Actinomadura sp. NEAU-AAG7]MBT2212078.1 hypothetical protein [Actinomadura sp. NEAU-AAG7]
MSTSARPRSPAHTEHTPIPRFFGLLKATTLFLATALLTQAITAGLLLSNEGPRDLHHTTAAVVSFAMVLQFVAALLVWRVGHGSARYLVVTVSMVLLISVQFIVGAGGDVAVHVPLGVALFGAGAVLVARVWGPRAAD